MSRCLKVVWLVLVSAATAACATGASGARTAPEPPDTRMEGVSAALLLGDADQAIDAYEKAFADNPQNSTTKVLHARLLLLSLRLDEALAEIDAVLAAEPNNADALLAKSLAAGLKGDTKSRKTLLEKVVKLDAFNGEAWASLGSVFLEERNYARAGECFTKAQALDGETLVTVVGLGRVAYRQRKFKEAQGYFDRAVELDPEYSFAYSDRALVKRQLGDQGGALADLDTAIRLEPDYPYNYYDRGRILMGQDKWREAVAEFTRALDKDPDLFIAFVMRAGLNDDMGNVDQAISDYENVLRLRNNYYFAYASLGALYWIKDQPDKAAVMFTKAFAADKRGREYALLAALALKKAGRADEAVAYLREQLSALPRGEWQYDMAQFFITPERDYTAVNDANKEKKKTLRGQILFYLAEQYLILEKKILARTYFSEAAAIDQKGVIEKKLARYELDRLGAP